MATPLFENTDFLSHRYGPANPAKTVLAGAAFRIDAFCRPRSQPLARPSLARAWVASGALKPLFGITALPVHGYYLLPFEGGGAAQEFAAWVGALCERVAQAGLREALAVQGVVKAA